MDRQALHNQLIEQACADGGWQRGWRLVRGGWKEAFRRKCREDDRWRAELADLDFEDVLRAATRYPDAWRIVNEDERSGHWSYPVIVVELLEVEVSNGISRDKHDDYLDLYVEFDNTSCFALRVFHMDRFGVVRPYITEDNADDVLSGRAKFYGTY